MKISCSIIQDLLPLYVDEICSAESRAAVHAHLEQCAACREHHAVMIAKVSNAKEENDDMKLVDGLKELKMRISKRTRIAVIAIAAAICIVMAGWEMMFNIPMKELKPHDVKVSAQVFAVDELRAGEYISGDDESVKISMNMDDAGAVYRVEIPAMPNADVTFTENVMQNTEHITVVNWESPYVLNAITWADGADESGVLYVDSIKTTFLNNASETNNQKLQTLEMRRISKIVYLEDDGAETVLWEE